MPQGIVESISVRRRAEEAARMHVVVSFSMRDVDGLLSQLARQLKMGLDVAFTNFQQPLPEAAADPAEAGVMAHKFMPGVGGTCDFCGASEGSPIHNVPLETVGMVVDGEDAQVQREPLSEEAERLIRDAAPPVEHWTQTPHIFSANSADNQCVWCHLGEENAIHHAEPEAAEAREKLAARGRNR